MVQTRSSLISLHRDVMMSFTMARKLMSIAEEESVPLVALAKGVRKILETALRMALNSSVSKEPAHSRAARTDDIIKTRLTSTVVERDAPLAPMVYVVSSIETASRVHASREPVSTQTVQTKH